MGGAGKTTLKYKESRHSPGDGGRENEYIGYWVHIIFECRWRRKAMTEGKKANKK